MWTARLKIYGRVLLTSFVSYPSTLISMELQSQDMVFNSRSISVRHFWKVFKDTTFLFTSPSGSISMHGRTQPSGKGGSNFVNR